MRTMTFKELEALQPVDEEDEAAFPLLSSGRPLTRYTRREGRASVRRGKPVEYEPRRVLGIRAIGNATVDHALVDDAVDIDVTVPSEAFTRAGDVVLALTAPFSVALVRAGGFKNGGDEGLLVTNSCVIIRVGPALADVLDARYLAGYLALPTVSEQQLLAKGGGGGRSPVLSMDQLREVSVQLPGLKDQQALGELLVARVRSLQARRKVDRDESDLVEAGFGRVLEEAGHHGE